MSESPSAHVLARRHAEELGHEMRMVKQPSKRPGRYECCNRSCFATIRWRAYGVTSEVKHRCPTARRQWALWE